MAVNAAKQLVQFVPLLRVLLFLAGLVSLLLVPLSKDAHEPVPGLAQNMYVDENALGVNIADAHVNDAFVDVVLKHERAFRAGVGEDARPDVDVVAVAAGRVVSLLQHVVGLDEIFVWSMDGTGSVPVDVDSFVPITSADEEHQHQLLYGILRAPHSDGRECVVLAVPVIVDRLSWASTSNDHNNNEDAAVFDSVMLASALGAYMRDWGVRWLARDIVFVVQLIDARDLSASRASSSLDYSLVWRFVDAYRSPNGGVHHAGRMLAAIVLDADSHAVTATTGSAIFGADDVVQSPLRGVSLTLQVCGRHGLLPNLDLVSVAREAFTAHGFSWHVADDLPRRSPLSPDIALSAAMAELLKRVGLSWLRLSGWLRFAVNQASERSVGMHGAFLEHSVDALTVRVVQRDAPYRLLTRDKARARQLLRGLESVMRSINNLHEKLHHSTFLYMLVIPSQFVTMNKYFVSLVLLGAPFPLTALLHVLHRRPMRGSVWTLLPRTLVLDFGKLEGSRVRLLLGSALASGVPLMLGEWAWEWLVGASVEAWTAVWVTIQIMVWFVVLPLLVRVFESWFGLSVPAELTTKRVGPHPPLDWRMLKVVLCVYLTCVLLPLGILNFALAIPLLVVAVLLTIPMCPSPLSFAPMWRPVLQSVLYIMCSPPMIAWYVSFLLAMPLGGVWSGFLHKAFGLAKHTSHFGMTGSLAYAFMFVVYVPAWAFATRMQISSIL